jgi:acyl-CoA-binding protein
LVLVILVLVSGAFLQAQIDTSPQFAISFSKSTSTCDARHRMCVAVRAKTGQVGGSLMSSLQDRFAQAQKDVNSLSSRPDNDTMLKLYALYKQATKGDVSGSRPDGFDFVGAAKYDAWSSMKGTSTEDAMQQYVDLVKSLVA